MAAENPSPPSLKRNDLCPCGSAKKYKKCCLARMPPFPPSNNHGPSEADCHQIEVWMQTGRFVEVEHKAQAMLGMYPQSGFLWRSLGIAIQKQGKDGLTLLRKATKSWPDVALAHRIYGEALRRAGQFVEAEASYQRALKLAPNVAQTHIELSFVEDARGQTVRALDHVIQSLQIEESDGAKRLFAYYAKDARFQGDDGGLRKKMMVRALTEHWGPSQTFSRAAIDLIKLEPSIRGCITRALNAWPARLSAEELFPDNTFAAVVNDPLLSTLLASALIFDHEMERFLSAVRYAMLARAVEHRVSTPLDTATLQFYCGLARQCFRNEYVYALGPDEMGRATRMRDNLEAALADHDDVPASWPIAVATYFFLHSLPHARRLLELQWPESVASVLQQQVREWADEQALLETIPQLTGLEGEASALVRAQYEKNPYPRWIEPPPASKATSVQRYLRRMFPGVLPDEPESARDVEVLVAGCGTGYHSIQTAQQFQGAHVLAIDLSLNSLVCAKRHTRELGVTSIEYAQADILKLPSIGREFDLIESVGVLHHLEDPWAGWSALLALLRPGGFMQVGLYSEIARRNIVRIRYLLAEKGYGATDDDIRRSRQDLIDLDSAGHFGNVVRSSDFSTMSACRDLLFHVQEHRVTLASIASFLKRKHLQFLGFELDCAVVDTYRDRFPDDPTATNLDHWQLFEYENPDTFLGMYTFWVQNKASSKNSVNI